MISNGGVDVKIGSETMSALPPKADIALHRSECPLCAKSGQSAPQQRTSDLITLSVLANGLALELDLAAPTQLACTNCQA